VASLSDVGGYTATPRARQLGGVAVFFGFSPLPTLCHDKYIDILRDKYTFEFIQFFQVKVPTLVITSPNRYFSTFKRFSM